MSACVEPPLRRRGVIREAEAVEARRLVAVANFTTPAPDANSG